ncbi:MAG: hypothetical protein HC875_03405 [Anaerolineales bacterium]|nr:hypothetical protein [Anaerolineales bacterium]
MPFKSLIVTAPPTPAAISRFEFLLGLWVIWRLPLLLALLYFFAPDEFIWLATLTAIHLAGTLPERVIFFLVMGLVLGGSFVLARRLPDQRGRFRAAPGSYVWLGLGTVSTGTRTAAPYRRCFADRCFGRQYYFRRPIDQFYIEPAGPAGS